MIRVSNMLMNVVEIKARIGMVSIWMMVAILFKVGNVTDKEQSYIGITWFSND